MKTRARWNVRLTTITAAFLAAAMVSAATAATPQYEIHDIGVIDAGDDASQGFGVSNDGTCVGRSIRTDGSQAFTWTLKGGIVGLPNLAGRNHAVANSAAPQIIVGTAATTLFGTDRLPVMWLNGVVSQLPLPAGETLGDANSVNASSVAVGSVDAGTPQRGVIYSGGSATIITQTTATGCFFVTAFGINDSGRVVGQGIDPNNAARNVGIVYDIGQNTAFEVGALPGLNGALAFGVSNSGYVVGSTMLNQGSGLPFIWSDQGGMVAIPLAIGTSQGSARAVNSAGWVVGTDSSAFAIPFLYDGTNTYRLADLIPPNSGWDLSMNTSSSADGISEDGVIVGTGVHNGETHAYAMIPAGTSPTPTPTPTATPTGTPTCTPGGTPGPWNIVANYPLMLQSEAITTDGTFAYSAGGLVHEFIPTDAFYRYDPGANIWISLQNVPVGGFSDAAAAYAANTNKIYVFGGVDMNFAVLDTTQIYDIASNTWTMGAPMPDPHGRFRSAAVYFSGNNKIYVIGGSNGATLDEQSQTWEYDPVADTWNTSRASIPVPMSGAGYSIVGQFVYLAGHWNNGLGSTDHYRYDIVADSWTSVAPVPVPIYKPAAAGVGAQEFLFGGGHPDNRVSSGIPRPLALSRTSSARAPLVSYTSTYVYDIVSNGWTTGPNTNVPHSVTAGTAIGDLLLVVAGFDGTDSTNVVESSLLVNPCGSPSPTATPTPSPTPSATPTTTPTATAPARITPTPKPRPSPQPRP